MSTFLSQPKTVFLRKVLFQVHLWTGIAIGIYLVVVCVTGSALVFRIHLERAVFPHLFTATPGEPADAATILERVRDAFPNDRISGIDAPTRDRPTTYASIVRDGRSHTILVDPTTGRILGERPSRNSVRALQDLHYNLLAGRNGRVINAAGGVLLLLLCATGLVIWWPGVATWRRGFTIDFRRSWRRVNWELHSAVGIWSVALISIWAVTGVYLIFPTQVRSAVNAVSPLTVVLPPTSNPTGAAAAVRPTWRELIARAEQQLPDQHVHRVVPPATDTDAFLVMFSRERPARVEYRRQLTSVFLDQYTGDVVTESPRAGRSAGDIIVDGVEWALPLHFGGFGGIGVRIAWLILGLTPPLLFMTGFIMWWSRVVRPRWLGSAR